MQYTTIQFALKINWGLVDIVTQPISNGSATEKQLTNKLLTEEHAIWIRCDQQSFGKFM